MIICILHNIRILGKSSHTESNHKVGMYEMIKKWNAVLFTAPNWQVPQRLFHNCLIFITNSV